MFQVKNVIEQCGGKQGDFDELLYPEDVRRRMQSGRKLMVFAMFSMVLLSLSLEFVFGNGEVTFSSPIVELIGLVLFVSGLVGAGMFAVGAAINERKVKEKRLD